MSFHAKQLKTNCNSFLNAHKLASISFAYDLRTLYGLLVVFIVNTNYSMKFEQIDG